MTGSLWVCFFFFLHYGLTDKRKTQETMSNKIHKIFWTMPLVSGIIIITVMCHNRLHLLPGITPVQAWFRLQQSSHSSLESWLCHPTCVFNITVVLLSKTIMQGGKLNVIVHNLGQRAAAFILAPERPLCLCPCPWPGPLPARCWQARCRS